MSTKHTPGPWIYDGDYIFSPSLGGYVANPKTEDMTSGDLIARNKAAAQIKANARLIAAAPELLDALREAIAWIPCGADSWHTDAPRKAIESARAVIAKATGEQQ